MGYLWTFIPDQALPLVLLIAGLALMVGARRLAGLLLAGVIVSLLLPPLIEPILGWLPGWALALVGAALLLGVARTVASLFLGSRGAETMTGHVAASAFIGLVRAPFTILGCLLRGPRRGR